MSTDLPRPDDGDRCPSAQSAEETEARATWQRVVVERWRDGERETRSDDVAEETPVALQYNGIAFAVMLATPADLEDFAVGFSLTEGIVAHPREIYDLEVIPGELGVEIRLDIASARFHELKERRRNLAGRTGCGLCGAEELPQVFRDLAPVQSRVVLTNGELHAAFAELRSRQPLQRVTGATHCAAWLDPAIGIACVREDVGRHNALDKLIGRLAMEKTDFAGGAALITSRASYEMVQKAAAVGIGLVAAISAPTGLAIRMAERLNVTLAGFVRNGAHVVYTHPHRLHP